MPDWTADTVLALAPDTASASAGQALSGLKKWSGTGRSERAIWGLCQGSGKDPYQARVDLGEPAFKCSCPSRKFPCKHGIGLLLLFAKDAASFKRSDEPGWVADWLASRTERAEKKAEKARAPAKPVDPEAQAKRAAKRAERTLDGVAACRVWLDDLLRRGLAAAKSENSSTWDRTAARMVDSQAPGLAGYIARIPTLLASGEGWEVRTLDLLGRLHLLLAAAESGDRLPPELSADVQTLLGLSVLKDEVLSGAGGPPVTDTWIVVGQSTTEDGVVRSRRTWLIGRSTTRRALLLDFAPGSRPFEASLPPGFEFAGELAYYPARLPLRALVKTRSDARVIATELGSAGDQTIEHGLERYARALAIDPWLARWPVVLSSARIGRNADRWMLMDDDGAELPLRPTFSASLNVWRLIAASAGRSVVVAAEWDGEFAEPVGLFDRADWRFCDLAPRWAA